MGGLSDRAVITPGNESSIVNWVATKPSVVRLNSLSQESCQAEMFQNSQEELFHLEDQKRTHSPEDIVK